MIRQGLLALALPFANIASAEGLILQSPVDCILGETCYIQQFMDRDPSSGVRDFQCRALSYNGHKGTDFALPTVAAMTAGVDVFATANGRVRGVRDGMPDARYSKENAANIDGKECGNGVVLVHPNGWETQYCHLKMDSIAVQNDQVVKAGEVLGQIGMSGRSEFPHLHLSVRQGGKPVDPFDPDGNVTCAAPGDSTLWADTPAYQPGGIIDLGLTSAIPEYAEIKAGTAGTTPLTTDAPALVVFGFTFGTVKGDAVRLKITGPDGKIIEKDQTFKRNSAQAFRALGKKRPRGGAWRVGIYTATASIIRNGAVIDTRSKEIEITEK